jgi:hypothetical protein
VYAARAASRWLRGSSAEALEMIEPIRHVVEVHGDSETRARLMSAEGGARFDAGDPSAIEPFRQVLRMALEANDSMAVTTTHLNLGEQLRTGWGVAEAIPVHERGVELAVQRRTGGAEQFLRHSLAVDYLLAGRWDDALAHLDASEEIPGRFSYLDGAFLGEKIKIRAGWDGASQADADLIDDVVREAESLKDLQAVVPAYDTAQFVHLMAGDDRTALRYARAIVDRSGATRYAIDAWPFTIWILRSAGELERAAALLDGLRRFEMPRPRALLAAADALLLEGSDPDAASAGLTGAAGALAALGNAVEAAVFFAEAHRIGAASGSDAAAAARDAAVRMLEPSGARALAARLGVA